MRRQVQVAIGQDIRSRFLEVRTLPIGVCWKLNVVHCFHQSIVVLLIPQLVDRAGKCLRNINKSIRKFMDKDDDTTGATVVRGGGVEQGKDSNPE
jgi:hypothetical protein